MNLEIILHALGRLLVLLGLLLGVPFVLAAMDEGPGGPAAQVFLVAAAASLCVGWALRLAFPWERGGFGVAEAFAVMSLGWVACSVAAALPFMLSGRFASPLDAIFEALSGLTTTGATVLADPRLLPRPFLAWRMMLHWFGGLATLGMVLAFLPALRAGGSFGGDGRGAEASGERPLLRFEGVVRRVWPVYGLFTVAMWAAFALAGLDAFESLFHACSVVSTGGFSTRAGSLGDFGPAASWVAAGGLVLGGASLATLGGLLRGRFAAGWRSPELRAYLLLVALAAAACAIWSQPGAALEPRLRDASLTAASTLSTSGLSAADGIDGAPALLRIALLLALAVGACSGSTGGGLKVARLMLVARLAGREIRRLLRPAAVLVVKLGGRPVPEEMLLGCGVVLFLHLLVASAAALAMLMVGLPLDAAWQAAISALSNHGNAFVGLGSTLRWDEVPPLARLVAMGCMLLGRLEYHAVLALLLPLAWRR